MGLSPRREPFWAAVWGGLWAASFLAALASPVASSLRRGEPVRALVFGTDKAFESQHSDTLLLASYDPSRGQTDLLSIPRDTRVHIPGYRFKRINEVFGFHMRQTHRVDEASQGLVSAVETVLSTEAARVEIPYYLQVDYTGFKRIVDLVGGVWVQILEPMDYDDFNGSYHFHAKPGRYRFMGEEALAYVRYRGQSGDKGRIFRQQGFIRTLAKRMLHPFVALRFPALLWTAWQSIHTNLRVTDIVALALELRGLRPDRIGFKILPGEIKGVYWAVDRESARFVVEQLVGSRPPDSRFVEPIRPLREKITVSVWNASGETGMARRVAFTLRGAGFDVVEWGNNELRQRATRVVDRSGNLEAARKVAEFLGTEDLHSEVTPSRLVDVDVVVGEDYRGPGARPGRGWGIF